ncbi:Gfo/Idh/MocA family oxidoreductase [Chitinophaga sp.]|uniref:Gfo/Idh/MocA family protein n=1 Tax=Chitinophaga sp. TaxID=1869181 RepID=UPI0031D39E9D
MTHFYDRRRFLQTLSTAGAGVALSTVLPFGAKAFAGADVIKVGIIGADSSHAVAFTKSFHNPTPAPGLEGFKVVAVLPEASPDIPNNVKRLPGFVDQLKQLGVEVVDTMDALLAKVDAVLVESNDGRPHYRQALPALKAGKRVFIDKPLAASLAEGMAIFDAARQHNTAVFSCSSLRYMETAQQVVKGSVGKVFGADTYSPCALEKTHPDIFWYGIHGVETLYTVMGPGCKSVSRSHTDNTDVVVGTWEDGRIGSFRGNRTGKSEYGGTVYGEKGNAVLGPFKGYEPLVVQIAAFFRTGKSPVPEAETLEILAFMEAADESKRLGGKPVELKAMFDRAKKHKKKK